MAAVAEQARIPAVPAYLDLAQPDLSTAAGSLADAGHATAVVVPLLFTEAYHATIDVPETVRDVAESLPLRASRCRHLGHRRRRRSAAPPEHGAKPASTITVQCCSSLSGRPSRRPTRPFLILRRGLRGAVVTPVRACFGTCAPSVADVLDELAEPVAIVPLFLAEGLLLSPVRALAAQHGWRMAEPLGERAADLVRQRYDSARVQLAS